MKEFELLKVDKYYDYLVLATSYVNPIDKLYEIEEDLEEKCYQGLVVFDLLLCNGVSANRYIEVYFNGNKFDICKYKNLNDIDSDTKKIAYSYYLQNLELLESSNLPRAQQFLLQNGIMI